ncbi:MAG: hypothetical protein WKF30_00830 [Pyrinomonadaceae bacterium]
MINTLKRVLFWNYGRSTWQYDVLCLLILAFIFLTPRHWFGSSELRSLSSHPNTASTVLIVADPAAELELSREEAKRRVQGIVKRPVTVNNLRAQRDENGRIVAFEVDIQ